MIYRRGAVLKCLAISQIYLIVLSVFSFAFLIYDLSSASAQTPEQILTKAQKEAVNNVVEPTAPQQVGAVSQEEYLDAWRNGPGGTTTGGDGVAGTYKGSFFGTGGPGYLVEGVVYAAAIVGAIQLIGGLAGWDDGLTNALSIGAGSGIMTTALLNSLHANGFGMTFGIGGEGSFLFKNSFLGQGITNAGAIGIGVAIVVFLATYKDESSKVYNFQCLPFEAPIGGKDCEKCNDDPYRPCSEYRCKSLGQSCDLVNVGSVEEKCVWVNPNDVSSPTITPWASPLTENHRYTNHDTRPTSLGTKIVLNGAANGCIKAFTPLTFGITTNEPAQCKIDIDHKKTLDEMQFFFGKTNLYLYNHTEQFSLPSPDAINTEAPELQEDGKYDFFVRCRDKNGNENVDEFAVQFCVDPTPDTTPPVIVETSLPTDSFVKFGATSVPLEVYVNEPATCKWSAQDKEYSVMENTMGCVQSITEINARELYACVTNLTGIADRQENKFYFRCKDQPAKPEEDRNVNINSYPFRLLGSQPLNIISVGPNGTVTGNTQTVPVYLRVVTDDGANEGIAVCSFNQTNNPVNHGPMFETNAIEHSQRQDLVSGSYSYKFVCVDYGGNAVEASTTFSVLVDTVPPLVTRAYHDSANNALKIVTNEDASCVYSLNSCNYNFNEGVAFLHVTQSNQKSHYAEWKPNIAYYIKCKDGFGNEPAPNSCNIVASPTNIR